MNGITFNGKHSYKDFGIIIEEKKILPPPKVKIKETVPFMSGTYDFSTIGTNGEQVYSEREIQIKFGLTTHQKQRLYILYSRVLEWLQDTGRQKLIFDDIPDFYFLAEVEAASDFEEVIAFGNLTVKFVAQPFKIGVSEEGNNQLWDPFNFEMDAMQDTEFDVSGSKIINIINVGRSACPVINTNAAMSITLGGKTYNVVVGDNNIYDLKLQPGDNSIAITGTGHIKFIFRKEVL